MKAEWVRPWTDRRIGARREIMCVRLRLASHGIEAEFNDCVVFSQVAGRGGRFTPYVRVPCSKRFVVDTVAPNLCRLRCVGFAQ